MWLACIEQNLQRVSPCHHPQRVCSGKAKDLQRVVDDQIFPSALQHRPNHNLGHWPVYVCDCMCVSNVKWLGWNKRLLKDGGFSAQSLTSHPSCHRREITCSRYLDSAVVPEDNALNQLFTPIEGINYQVAGKQKSALYSWNNGQSQSSASFGEGKNRKDKLLSFCQIE